MLLYNNNNNLLVKYDIKMDLREMGKYTAKETKFKTHETFTL